MRKLKPGSPFRHGTIPSPLTKRGRGAKSAAEKHAIAPASLRRTRKFFEERGGAYDPHQGRVPAKYLNSKRLAP